MSWQTGESDDGDFDLFGGKQEEEDEEASFLKALGSGLRVSRERTSVLILRDGHIPGIVWSDKPARVGTHVYRRF